MIIVSDKYLAIKTYHIDFRLQFVARCSLSTAVLQVVGKLAQLTLWVFLGVAIIFLALSPFPHVVVQADQGP